MIATLNVKHGLRVTDCDSPTDAKYCASSTNSRLRQLVAEVFEGRTPSTQDRTIFGRGTRLCLTRRPLHSRSRPCFFVAEGIDSPGVSLIDVTPNAYSG